MFPPVRCRTTGFTLVEPLVVLAIVGAWLGQPLLEAANQRAAVARLLANGGEITYS